MEDCAFRLFSIEKDLKYPDPAFGHTYDVADFRDSDVRYPLGIWPFSPKLCVPQFYLSNAFNFPSLRAMFFKASLQWSDQSPTEGELFIHVLSCVLFGQRPVADQQTVRGVELTSWDPSQLKVGGMYFLHCQLQNEATLSVTSTQIFKCCMLAMVLVFGSVTDLNSP